MRHCHKITWNRMCQLTTEFLAAAGMVELYVDGDSRWCQITTGPGLAVWRALGEMPEVILISRHALRQVLDTNSKLG